MTGWIANILIVISWWYIGEKNRIAFVLAGAGETMWAIKAAIIGMWDLVFICGLFVVVSAYNWIKWGRP